MTDLNALPLDNLYDALCRDGLVRRLLELARDEDLGPARQDITSSAVDEPDRAIAASLVARGACTLAGLAAVPDLLDVFGGRCTSVARAADGDSVEAGAVLATIEGPLAQALAVERTLLNLLSRLCGVATATRALVHAVEGTAAGVYDTRKTTPGMRALEKYAVRCGGGRCHRLGLYDAVLIKDNHVAGRTGEALRRFVEDAAARARAASTSPRFIEVEVDSIDQFDALLALPAGVVDIALLDNFTPALLRDAVRRRNNAGAALLLEASGGVTLATVRAIAETGVERISASAITQGAAPVDLALDRTA